ncbi:hypothetical protein RCC89_17605 [Cytophagaceae bacterium ABcell3]|nr:hypothetical protein RCC89_17605 [Cytophagaceae bacterium ABcell3]
MKENTENGLCRVFIINESPSAMEFGEELEARVLGRETTVMNDEYLRDLYPGEDELQVLVTQDKEGNVCKVPEKDIERIQC